MVLRDPTIVGPETGRRPRLEGGRMQKPSAVESDSQTLLDPSMSLCAGLAGDRLLPCSDTVARSAAGQMPLELSNHDPDVSQNSHCTGGRHIAQVQGPPPKAKVFTSRDRQNNAPQRRLHECSSRVSSKLTAVTSLQGQEPS